MVPDPELQGLTPGENDKRVPLGGWSGVGEETETFGPLGSCFNPLLQTRDYKNRTRG